MMNVAFVTEGGPTVGLGHIRRCTTLARELSASDVKPGFYVVGSPAAAAYIADLGFPAATVKDILEPAFIRQIEESGANAVVVDTYSATEVLLHKLKPVRVVIDDLADRALPAEILVNPALSASPGQYRGLTAAKLLLGPRYSLLRGGFSGAAVLPPEGLGRIIVAMGGGDSGELLNKVAEWCLELAPLALVHCIIGPFAESSIPPPSSRLVIERNANMPEVMKRADLMISGGGQILFEVAAAGLPALVIETASNQRTNIRDFVEAGTILRVGQTDDATLKEQFETAFRLINVRMTRALMSARGPRLVDARGAARVATAVIKECEAAVER